MIGKGHLRVLGAVNASRTKQELTDSLGYTPSTISNLLGDLETIGLVDRERNGTQVTVRPTEARCVDVHHSIVSSNPHVDFPDLLTKSTLVLLYHLDDEPILATTLVERTGLSTATVYRQLNTLQNRAMVLKDESRYRLAEEFVDLHTFAVELYHLVHRQRIKADTSGGVLVWETHDEFLVRTDEEVDGEGYHWTGLAMFAEYGLQFLTTPAHYYFYAPARDSLDAMDLVCHLLLVENDVRNRQYAMLLIAQQGLDREELHQRAEHYRMTDVVDPLVDYLETHGEKSAEHLPPWDQFESLADDYEVEV